MTSEYTLFSFYPAGWAVETLCLHNLCMNHLQLRSNVVEVDKGTVMLLFDAWQVNLANKWCRAKDGMTSWLVVTGWFDCEPILVRRWKQLEGIN